MAADFVQSAQEYLLARRASLIERGVIAKNGDGLRLAESYKFDSPSTAAGVVLGRSTNGRELWEDAEGRSLKENQSAAVAETSEE